MKKLILIMMLTVTISAGAEIVTVENGYAVYNTAPITSLSQKGTLLEQARKIRSWLIEIEKSIEDHGDSIPAKIALQLIDTEVLRISEATEKTKTKK